MNYLIAVDGGGTGCRALLALSDGTVLSKGEAGPANIGADTEAALIHIGDATRKAVRAAGLNDTVFSETRAVLGLAGANSLADHAAVTKRLPFANTMLVSDAATALQGALGDGDGAMAILGTGSAFVKRQGETVEIVGGRGFMLSDHAGGARLGRELLEESLLVLDGMAKHSLLADVALAQFDHDARRVTGFSRRATAADYAAFAPLIFEHAAQGDTLGLSILHRACDFLHRGLERIGVEALGRYSLTGGLATFYAALPFLPYRSLYEAPRGDALQGALALAVRHIRQA